MSARAWVERAGLEQMSKMYLLVENQKLLTERDDDNEIYNHT